MNNTANTQTKQPKQQKVTFLVTADGNKALPGASDWFAEYIQKLNKERA